MSFVRWTLFFSGDGASVRRMINDFLDVIENKGQARGDRQTDRLYTSIAIDWHGGFAASIVSTSVRWSGGPKQARPWPKDPHVCQHVRTSGLASVWPTHSQAHLSLANGLWRVSHTHSFGLGSGERVAKVFPSKPACP